MNCQAKKILKIMVIAMMVGATFCGCSETESDSKNYASDKKEYDVAEKQGIKFSDDGKTLVKCPADVKNVIIPRGVTVVGEKAFQDCKALESVVIPDSVEELGQMAFYRCSNLKEVVIPGKVKYIPMATFAGCSNLEKAVIPDGVESIGIGAFDGCSNLKSVTIPDSVKNIWAMAFSRTPLKSVTVAKDTKVYDAFPEGCEVIRR